LPIRIYSLAKELNIENKDLVDICTKAGITGKGSALASLTDEETDRVKSFLGVGAAAAEKSGAKTSVAVKTAPMSRTATVTEPAAFTRDDYIAPVARGKIRVIDSRTKRPPIDTKRKEADDEAGKPPTKKEPVVQLAKLPEVKQPGPTPKADEPKPQKPEIRLPMDAIRGAKAGTRAPLEHLTKGDKKAKPGDRKKTPGTGEAAAAETPLGKTGTRDRRRTKEVTEAETVDSKMGNTRALRAKERKARQRTKDVKDDDSAMPRRGRRRLTRTRTANTAAPRKGKVAVALPCTVRSFSEATGVATGQIIMTLMNIGQRLTINQQIDAEYVDLLAAELGLELEFKQHATLEESLLKQVLEEEDDPDSLEPRPPIVTFLGHVDHGKTSLLDRILGLDVVSGEAGGITQHIRAYSIDKGGRKIGFVDTPGHEAFTEMRARGANVTDIAVLVVAADDGIMPQTEEAISHAKAAGVPIVVALNKMDLPGADANRAMQQLAAHELLPSEWGGETEVVRTSAIKGEGIDDLLETLLLTADIHDYKANPRRAAVGTCLEAEQQAGRGIIAKLMVQKGTLNVGDIIVCGAAHGRVKAMHDTLRHNVRLKKAGPSIPVNVTGLDVAPQAGDKFVALKDIIQAREIAEQRALRSRELSLAGVTTKVSFEKFQQLLEEGRLGESVEMSTLNLIVRADVRGSIEAILKELGKFDHPEVQIKILQSSVGAITVGDVTLAHASAAVIIGFNVIPDDAARALAEDRQVEIRRYEVIYKVADDIKAMLEGKLKPEKRIVELGHALVKQVFPISRVGVIAGCYVAQGSIERNCRIRVNRDGRTIGDYPLESLKREKDDTREVSRGLECGIKLAGFNDLKVSDILEAYKIEEVARTL
jgi:translation initiation factor IF-2